MDPVIKQKWIDALTGGEYRQGREALRKRSGYCCLGVLCDLYRKETGKGKWSAQEYTHGQIDFVTKQHYNTLLPLEVVEWAGFEPGKATGEGDLYIRPSEYSTASLAALNDQEVPFHKIAKVILENF